MRTPLPLALVALALVALTGCSRKAAEAPPVAATPPPASSTTPDPATASRTGSDDQAPVLEMDPVFFAYDSDRLDEKGRAALDRIARQMRAKPAMQLRLEGHCDERGTVEYNQALGERRVQVAANYLFAAGIDRSRVETISYGKERPFADGHEETAWALNRRAHPLAR